MKIRKILLYLSRPIGAIRRDVHILKRFCLVLTSEIANFNIQGQHYKRSLAVYALLRYIGSAWVSCIVYLDIGVWRCLEVDKQNISHASSLYNPAFSGNGGRQTNWTDGNVWYRSLPHRMCGCLVWEINNPYIWHVFADNSAKTYILMKAFLLYPGSGIWTISYQREKRYKRSCSPYMPFGHIVGLAWGYRFTFGREVQILRTGKTENFPRFSFALNLPFRGILRLLIFRLWRKD